MFALRFRIKIHVCFAILYDNKIETKATVNSNIMSQRQSALLRQGNKAALIFLLTAW